MGISLVGTAEAATVDGANVTIDLTTITGLAPGDLVCVFGGNGNVSVSPDAGVVTPSGYTEDTQVNDGVTLVVAFSYKFMGSPVDTSVTGKGGGSGNYANAYIAMVFRGVDPASPIDAATTTANSVAAAPDSPSITTVTDRAAVISFGATGNVDTSVTAPSGYTGQVDVSADDTADITVGGAYKIISPPGAENPAAWTTWSGLSTTVAFSVALRPIIPRPGARERLTLLGSLRGRL